MSERAAVALAAAIAVGAHVGGGPSPAAGALLVVIALAARRPWLVCLAAALLAAGLADRARAGLDPVVAGPFQGWVTLVTDPAPLDGGGIAVVVRAEGRRVEALAHGPPAWALEDRLAGERALVTGRLRPPPLPLAPWLVQRRIVGRLGVDEVLDVAGAPPVAAAANALRRTIDEGATELPVAARSLLTGVVLGDDRHQPPELADDFRAAGLVHLLAVSGQNARNPQTWAIPCPSVGVRGKISPTYEAIPPARPTLCRLVTGSPAGQDGRDGTMFTKIGEAMESAAVDLQGAAGILLRIEDPRVLDAVALIEQAEAVIYWLHDAHEALHAIAHN